MLEAEGVHYLFAPGVADMYPRPMETVVDVPKLGAELEGSVRPGHFAGVATVVTKLFNIAGPDRAYFGEKDFQQLTIIRRMVDDMAQPVEVIGVPTVREADGLACSSRNVYLTAEERAAAVIVPRALEEAERLIAAGETDAKRLEEGVAAFIRSEPLARPEVVAVRDPETLAEIDRVGGKPVLLLLFVRFGGTKLLDNRVLGPKNAKKVA
jgi:pantoate--beta-alanine ligase